MCSKEREESQLLKLSGGDKDRRLWRQIEKEYKSPEIFRFLEWFWFFSSVFTLSTYSTHSHILILTRMSLILSLILWFCFWGSEELYRNKYFYCLSSVSFCSKSQTTLRFLYPLMPFIIYHFLKLPVHKEPNIREENNLAVGFTYSSSKKF